MNYWNFHSLPLLLANREFWSTMLVYPNCLAWTKNKVLISHHVALGFWSSQVAWLQARRLWSKQFWYCTSEYWFKFTRWFSTISLDLGKSWSWFLVACFSSNSDVLGTVAASPRLAHGAPGDVPVFGGGSLCSHCPLILDGTPEIFKLWSNDTCN